MQLIYLASGWWFCHYVGMDERLANSLKYCQNRNAIVGCIYIVGCNEFVKIGYAKDCLNRFSNLQTGNPYDVFLLVNKPSSNPADEELALHGEFAKYHHRGEWYKLPPEIKAGLLSRFDKYRVGAAIDEIIPTIQPKAKRVFRPYKAEYYRNRKKRPWGTASIVRLANIQGLSVQTVPE